MTPTVEEILQAIQDAAVPWAEPTDARTTEEWYVLIGCGKRKMELNIRALLAAGKMERVKVRRVRIDGAVVTVPAYRLLR